MDEKTKRRVKLFISCLILLLLPVITFSIGNVGLFATPVGAAACWGAAALWGALAVAGAVTGGAAWGIFALCTLWGF